MEFDGDRSVLEPLAQKLREIEVDCRVVARDALDDVPRGYRCVALQPDDDSIWRARMVTGAELFIDVDAVYAIHLHTVGEPLAGDDEDAPERDGSSETETEEPRLPRELEPYTVLGKKAMGQRAGLLLERLEELGLAAWVVYVASWQFTEPGADKAFQVGLQVLAVQVGSLVDGIYIYI